MYRIIIIISLLLFLGSIAHAESESSTLYKMSERGELGNIRQTLVANFLQSAKNGELENVEMYLSMGINANTKGDNGYTALIMASERGYISMAKLLITYSADVNIKGDDGNTAIILASLNGQTEIAKLLLTNKAQIDIKNSDNFTALIRCPYQCCFT